MVAHAGVGSLGIIVASLIKSSAVLLAAILLAWLFRRKSASLRHFMLSLFLICLIFFPLFSSFPSGWEVRWLPSWFPPGEDYRLGDEPRLLIGSLFPGESQANVASGSVMQPPERSSEANTLRAAPRSGFGRILGMGFLAVWAAGLIALLLRLALGVVGAFKLTREGERLDDSTWQRLLKRFILSVSLRRKVNLKSHHRVLVPLTWGFLRPVVIMPAEARAWSEEQRSSALFHELSHVKRGDFLILLLVRLSLALYWLNPLTWVVFRMLKADQEKACDELVLKAGIRPSTYAANLLSFKRAACRAGSPAAAFLGVLGMFGRSQLNGRLAAILGQKFAFKEVKMKTKVLISAISFLAVALIGLARPSRASHPYGIGTIAQEPVIGEADSLSLETAVQESQQIQESQEKKQTKKADQPQKQEEKAQKETIIQLGAKEGKEGPIEITVIEGDSKKTILVDKPVIRVKNGEGEKKIVVLSGGKEVLVVEGDEVQLKVKGDKTAILQSAEPLKLDEGLVIRSTPKDGKGERQIIVEGEPHVEIVKEVDIPGRITIHVGGKEGEDKTVVVEPHVVVEPQIAMEPHVAVEPRVEVKPHVVVEPRVRVHELVTGAIRWEELQKIIVETQALLQMIEDKEFDEAKLEAQKETFQELKEALKDLKQELEKEKEGLKAIQVKVDEPKKSYTVVLPKPHVRVDGEVDVLEEGKDNIITIIDDKGSHTVIFTGKLREGQLEAYEKVVDKLKKDLPEGYEVESEFHEKSGTIVIKVKGHDTTEESREAVKSLMKGLVEGLKKQIVES